MGRLAADQMATLTGGFERELRKLERSMRTTEEALKCAACTP